MTPEDQDCIAMLQDDLIYNDPLYKQGFQAGAASRDAEVQRLQFALSDTEALELGTAERCDQLRAELAAEQANNTRLRDFIASAQVSSGVCCCGEAMDGHSSPMSCGHSPVDLWDHSVISVLSATPNEALAQFAERVLEQVIEACSDGTGPSGNLLPLSTVAKIRAIKEIP